MPDYKVPAVGGSNVAVEVESKKHQPSIYVPMKKEWLGQIKIGEKIEVLLKGKVQGIHINDRENDEFNRSEVEMALDVVSYYKSKNEIEKFLKETEEREEG